MSTDTEQRLQEALSTVADGVYPPPDAYVRTRLEWRRRERRRRRVAVTLAVVVIAVADAIGLWALNRSESGSPVIFKGPAPVQIQPATPRTELTPAPPP